jgi:hypothetical protein
LRAIANRVLPRRKTQFCFCAENIPRIVRAPLAPFAPRRRRHPAGAGPKIFLQNG